MDKKHIIESELEKLDFVLISVKQSGLVTASDLFAQHSSTFLKLGLTETTLRLVLSVMVKDGFLLQDDNNFFFVNPIKPEFISFKHKYLRENFQKKIDRILEFGFKLTPICLTIVFGIITTFVSFSNYNLSKHRSDNSPNKIILEIDTTSIYKGYIQKNDTLYILSK